MDYHSFIDTLTPDVVARLRQGIETGRWPDGRELTPAQREHSLQAVIAWETKHLPEDQRVGYIDTSKKDRAAARRQAPKEQSLRWVTDNDETSGRQ